MHMFELSVALKYLTPRWRQLSVSIITLISMLVISLVVWLIVVFFSVTHGLEKNWVQKLIALTAPIRITPTEQYYQSHYYQIDGISAESDYTHKTIGEKLVALKTDPYDPLVDEELPTTWAPPILDASGEIIDPVKIAFEEINKIKGVKAKEYEMTFSNIRLRLLRKGLGDQGNKSQVEYSQSQSFISQSAYLATFDPSNPHLEQAVLPVSNRDVENVLNMLTVASDNIQEENPDTIIRLNKQLAQNELKKFFTLADVKTLQTPKQGWRIPKELYSANCKLEACVLSNRNEIRQIIIPASTSQTKKLFNLLREQGNDVRISHVMIDNGKLYLVEKEGKIELPERTRLLITGAQQLLASIVKESLDSATKSEHIQFLVSLSLQGNTLKGKIPLGRLEIAEADVKSRFNEEPTHAPSWFYQLKPKGQDKEFVLPVNADQGDGILLPKSFRDAGVLVGDRGYLSYYSPTATSVQEQRVSIAVAGFYDPGIIPIGGKLVLASPNVISMIRPATGQEDSALTNGINVRFDNLNRADEIKQKLEAAFKSRGIDKFWKVETYKEFDFTRDIIKQLKSEKNLFSLLAIVIIVVACSNIISMLIILVNDKKRDIGILRSMGATSASIALIFGSCGIVMGLAGSLFGILMAVITLHNLDGIISLLSSLQGHEMFNPGIYGDKLPTELSFEALVFVIVITAVISTIAGIVPAIKACLLRPTEILRSE